MSEFRVLTPDRKLVGFGLEPILLDFVDGNFRPQSYDTVEEVIEALDLPVDPDDCVVWNPAWDHLEQAFAAMSDGQYLVLPEREAYYELDTSNGFMALNVLNYDGVGPDGIKDGSKVPVVSNPRLWFEMSRARKGIIGLGPDAKIRPRASSWTCPSQAVLQRQPAGSQFCTIYFAGGTTQPMNGAQNGLIGCYENGAVMANFTLEGRDFGGVAYSGIKISNNTTATVKRIHFDGCWRSHEGVPNGETGGLTLNRTIYLVENCDFDSKGTGASPIMWNSTKGGVIRDIRSSEVPNYGMFTYWNCGGPNVWERVWMECNRTGMNLEINDESFSLTWITGRMNLNSDRNKFHFVMNPAGVSYDIYIEDVDFSPNGFSNNHISTNVYTDTVAYPVTQKRSDFTAVNTLPVAYLPGDKWID